MGDLVHFSLKNDKKDIKINNLNYVVKEYFREMGDLAKKYNLKSPGVKRLMREAAELSDPTDQYFAQPLEDNLFEWHFTVRGPSDSEFEDGCYHGRITLPPEYPMKPPSIILITPNGRFEVGRKICLSMSAHHPETWQPSWSIRTVLLALIGFMPTPGNGAIGALDYTPEERKKLAKKSKTWKCEICGCDSKSVLLERDPEKVKEEAKEVKELAAQFNFKGEGKSKTTDTPESEQQQSTSPQQQLPTHQRQNNPTFNPNLQNQYQNYYAQYGMFNNPGVQFPGQYMPGQAAHNPGQSAETSDPIKPNRTESKETDKMNSPSQPTNDSQSTEDSTDSGTIVDRGLRQRANKRQESVSNESSDNQQQQRTVSKPSCIENFTLVLTWIVTVLLVALILRRLAYEGTGVGQ